ncbi:YadA-like family protein [Bartonella schoenbuchensis]
MKKVHIAPKNKSFNAQRFLSEVSLVRAVSLGAVMAGLLSSVSPVFASHLSSTGLTVQSVSAGVISANVAHGRVGVVNGDRFCGVDQVVSRGLSSGNKEQYKKLTANRLSDGSGGYSFESSCRADASVNALPSTSARSLIDVAAEDWFLEENNTINGSVNTRSVNTTGTHVVKMQTRGVVDEIFCKPGEKTLCVGEGEKKENYNVASTDLSDKSTEAVNSPQPRMQKEIDKLKSSIAAVKEDITKLNDGVNLSLGGGANVLEGKAPTYEIQQQSYTGVADAFAGVDSKLTELSGKINSIGIDPDGAYIFRDPSNDKLIIGANYLGTEVSIANIEGKARKLTGLADGSVTEGSTEAVTGNQLYKVEQSIKGVSSAVEELVTEAEKDIQTLAKNIDESLGGGSNILDEKRPVYWIQEKGWLGVGAAFKGVDENLTELNQKVDTATSMLGISLVAQEKETNIITIGSGAAGDKISIVNSSQDPRTLTGLKDGKLSDKSTEAITGNQLYELGSRISQYLGGDADVLKGTAPIYSIQDKERRGVADAFTGVDETLTALSEKLDKVESVGGDSLVAQHLETKVITIGGKVEGNEISIANIEGKARTLSGLADGEVDAGSTEAVTGKQLYGVKQSVDGFSSTIEGVQDNVSTLDKKLNEFLGGGANVLKGEAPTYSIDSQKYTGVEAAFGGVDKTLTELSSKVSDVEKNSLVKQDKSGLITIGANVEGGEISIANNTGGVRKLTGLEKGKLSDESADAVTGAQLYKVEQSVKELSSAVETAESGVLSLAEGLNEALGGGADVLNGQRPEYEIQSQNFTSVAAAFKGVDNTLTTLSEQVKDVTSVISNSLVVQDEGTNVITIGAKVKGNEISIANIEGGARKLSGLADGEVDAGSTEAVTGKQLYKVEQSVKELSSTVATAESGVSGLAEGLNEALGGNADVLKGTAPIYSIQNKERIGVADAFAGVDETLTALSEKVENVTGVVNNSLVVQDEDTNVITIGAKAEGNKISIVNSSQNPRTLTGLKDGKLSNKSTDAVTGKQLYSVQEKFKPLNAIIEGVRENVTTLDANINEYLGGDANVLGSTAPTYSVQDGKYHSVADAFAGVDTSLTDLYEKFSGLQNSIGDDSLVAQDQESKLITIGANVEGSKISITNSKGKARTLTGLADGEVDAGSTEAVTGAQLYGVQEKFKSLNAIVEGVRENVTTLDANINKYLGGGADVLEGTQLTYSVQDGKYHSVASAFEGVDTSLTDLYEKLDKVESVGRVESVGDDSLVAQRLDTKVITIGSEVKGSKISITNSKGQARKLTGLADGSVTEGSTEAVTGNQLFDVEQKFEPLNILLEEIEGNVTALDTNIDRYLGGGADILEGKAPTYKIQGKSYYSVGTAFIGVSNTLTTLSKQVKDITSVISNSLVVQDEDTNVITIGAKVKGNEISIVNIEGGARKLTGLADGEVNAGSTEAVTGKQLYEVEQSVKELSSTVATAESGVSGLAEGLNEALGGNADVLKGTAPIYSIQNKERIGVADAFAGVDETLTALSEKVENVTGVVNNSLVVQDEGTNVITIGAKVKGNEISIANSSQDLRTLTGLKDGELSDKSTDAVTGKQLYSVQEKFKPLNAIIEGVRENVTTLDANINEYLGGDANVLGSTAPTYSVQDGKYHSVADAFAGVDTSLTDLYEKFSGLQNSIGDDSLVAQDQESKLITIGANVEGSKISITNSKGKARTLTGLADGEVDAGSTDAVTGAQLYSVQEKFKPLNAIIEGVRENVTTLDANINKYLGGGADVLEGTQLTYSVQDGKYHSVASAFEGVDTSLTDLYEKLDKVESVGDDSLVAQHLETKVITIGGKVEGSKISITNSKGKARTLTGLKDGSVTEGSTEAVTGNQLFDVGQKFEPLNILLKEIEGNVTTLDTNINKYLGGGADVLEGKAPTYKIQGNSYHNVGTAFIGVNNTLTTLSKQVENVTNASVDNSLVVQDEDTNVITIGAKVKGNEISIANIEGGARKLTGLADGEVNAGSTEAVTGKQLYEVEQSVKELSSTVATAESGVSGLAEGLNEALGGNADVLKGTAPIYSIQNKERIGVADAFAGVDETLTALSEKVENVTGVVNNSLVVQDEGTNVITIGAKVKGNEISIANSSQDLRTLTGLKDGELSDKSTDAVTGKQLYSVQEKFKPLNAIIEGVRENVTTLDANINEYLGGDANVLGSTAPTYSVQDGKYHSVADAFAGVDTSLTDLYEKFSGLQNSIGDDSLVAQDQESKLITIGANVEGSKISITNSKGKARTLTGLADGEVDAGSTDAVTGAQLYSVQEKFKPLNAIIEGVRENVTTLDANINKYLGGGADVLEGTQLTYSVQDGKYHSVASAFEGVDTSLTDLYEKLDKVESVGDDSLVAQHLETKVITIGGKVEGSKISITNSKGKARTLTGLKDGSVTEGSTEAVTGNQLFDVGQKFEPLNILLKEIEGNVTTLDTNINKYLGGGADVLEGKAPTYKIQGNSYHNVGTAFIGVNNTLTTLSKQVENVTNASVDNSLVVQDEDTNVITIGAKVKGNEISIANIEGGARKLTGLADGEVNAGSTEAVTGKQLYEVEQSVKELSSTVATAESGVSGLAEGLNEALGGNADVLKGTAPIYSIQNKERIGVADAFAGVDETLTALSEKVENVTGVVNNSLVVQDEGTNVITIGAKVKGNEISIANSSQDLRTLTGLKDGELSDKSTDAVTGKQLYSVQEKFKPLNAIIEGVRENVTTLDANINEYLGGDANVLGSTAPTYSVQDGKYHSVADAFAGVDTSLTDLYEKFSGLQNSIGDDSLVAQDQESKLITIGANVEGSKISITNSKGKARTLTGLADGEVDAGSTDAVTGAQLYSVQEKFKPLNAIIEGVRENVTTLDANINKYLGGGADVLEGTQLTYSVQDGKYHSVASAFEGVDTSLTDLYEKLDKVESVGDDSLVAQHLETKVITIGGKVEGSKISITNSKGKARTLTGLKDGSVTEGSTEAVTGNQLFDVGQKFEPLNILLKEIEGNVTTLDTNINKYLGGGADVLEGKAPTYKIQGNSYHNVGTAFIGVNNTLTTLSKQVENVTNASVDNSLVVQDEDTNVITIGAKVKGNEISIANIEGGARKLTGLADGEVNAGSTEAVTGKQLYEVEQSVKELSSTVATAESGVSGLAEGLNEALGGNADVLKGTAPIYSIQNKERIGVADAFAGVDETLTALSEKVENVTGVVNNSLVVQDEGTNVITIGAKVKGNEISIANSSQDLRTLTGLKDGELSDKSTDAVTGKQLYSVQEKFKPLNAIIEGVRENVTTLDANINEYLGGDANVLGSTAPTYSVQDGKYHSVADAFAGVDTSLTDLYEKFSGLQNSIGDDSLVAQDQESKLITIGANVEGSKISITNSKGKARTLTGLADGEVDAGSTDAVTGAQLYSVQEKFKPLNAIIEGVRENVTTLDANINKYLGGGADVLEGTQLTYSVQDGKYHSVASAFEGVDTSLTDLYEKLDKVESVGDDSLVAQHLETKVITIGGKVEGSKISITNSKGKARTLTGLKDGSVTEGSTEAVTGNQLFDVGQKFEPLNILLKEIEGNVTTLDTNINKYLGGGADVLEGKAPTYKIQGNSYHNVGTAFIGVNNTLTTLSKQVENVTNASVDNSLVVQDEDTNVITIGAKVKGNEISIANSSQDLRTLTGLKDGELSDKSTDAVTGKQLYSVQEKFKPLNAIIEGVRENVTTLDANINEYLGGDANVLGSTAPTYSVQDGKYHSVADAFAGVDTSLTDLYEKFSGLQNSIGDDSLVAQDQESKLITIGANVEGSKISITNSKGKARTLTGLADGEVDAGSTDAVTGAQLYSVQEKFKPLNAIIEGVRENVTTLDANINKYLGGGADVLEGTQLTYSVQDGKYHSVASAFEGVDTSLTDLYEKLDKVESVGDDSLVAQHLETKVITIGGKVEGSKISITNSKGKARTLTGLKDGSVTEGSTEAVTGNQLFDVGQKFEPLNILLKEIEGNVTTLDTNINKYLGGGADVLEGKAPTYKIQGNSYHNVGTAFIGVNNTLTTLSKQVENVTNASVDNSLVVQDEDTNVITIGAKVKGNEISIANSSQDLRTLTGLKDGELSDKSTDAVTGKQLYSVQEKFKPLNAIIEGVRENVTTLDANINEYLGGDANVLGSTAPTYSVQDGKYHSVADAFAGVDTSLTDLYEKFSGLQNSIGDDSLVAQDQESKLITIGANVEGSKISITNSKGKARTLTGLADGEVDAGSTDAVTGAQLYSVQEKFKPLNAIIEGVRENVTTLDANINKYLGGGADVLEGTQLTYSVQDGKYHSVASAFEGVDTSLTDLYEKLDKVESVGDDSLVAQHLETKVITIGGKVEGSKISITNSKGKARTLTGLKDGSVTEGSTEAVTGNQLFDVGQKFEPLNILLKEIEGNVTTLDTNINKYLGGGADVLEGKAPTYKIQGNSYHNVGTAFIGVNNTLTTLSKQVENIENNGLFVRAGGGSLIEQDPLSHIITIGAKTGGNEISIANKNGESRILSGVKDGKITADSTEAITGNQLYVLNKQLAAYFGGGAGYQDGKWTDPTFTITDFGAQGQNGEQTYNNVAEAFGAVNSSMSGLNDRIKQVEQQTGSQVNSNSLNWNNDKNAYDASHNGQVGKITDVADGTIAQGSTDAVTGNQLWATNEKIDNLEGKVDDMISGISTLTDGVVTYDKDTNGNKINSITLVGTDDDTPVLIANVADGKVEEGSKQAVNGGQLHGYVKEQTQLALADANKYTDEKIENIVGDAVAQSHAYTDMKFNALSYKINVVQKEARQAAAIGLAVSNLRYNDTPGKLSIAFGSGVWRGQSAPAFGAGYTSEDGDIRSNFSVTTSGGHWGVGAGISFTLN